MIWTLIDWYRKGKPSLVGMCVGAIAGLATITPAAGFIRPWAAFLIGALAGAFCYACVELKSYLKWDDALDVWGVHGMGGALGSILLGILADHEVGGQAADFNFFSKQLATTFGCAAYSYIVTMVLLKLLDMCTRIKSTPEEMKDIDMAFHGESAYGVSDPSAVTTVHSDIEVGKTSTSAIDVEIPTAAGVLGDASPGANPGRALIGGVAKQMSLTDEPEPTEGMTNANSSTNLVDQDSS